MERERAHLIRPSGRNHKSCSKSLRKLNRSESDATRSSMNENRLPGLHLRNEEEGLVRRQPVFWD